MSEAESNSQNEDVDLEVLFPEYHVVPLSDRDRDFFLGRMENPPEPTDALRKLLAKRRKARQSRDDSEYQK